MKILAIQFRYLGDAAMMTPALRAIKERFLDGELHVLVAKEVAPLLQHLPWLTRVWPFPRTRGKAGIKEAWPLIRALRRERFDRSVDFGGNDRSAIISRLCGARQRLAPDWPGGFFGRRFCYTQTFPTPASLHQTLRDLHLLSVWGIAAPSSLELEIRADPACVSPAAHLLPGPAVLCHLTASRLKKEWPLANWAAFARLASAAGLELVFSAGITPREQSVMTEFKKLAPDARTLPAMPDLAVFLAVIERARLFVSADTGPLHFAAGLKVPTVALFGPTPARGLAPLGRQHQAIQGGNCTCDCHTSVCLSATPCMAAISPEAVLRLVRKALDSSPVKAGR